MNSLIKQIYFFFFDSDSDNILELKRDIEGLKMEKDLIIDELNSLKENNQQIENNRWFWKVAGTVVIISMVAFTIFVVYQNREVVTDLFDSLGTELVDHTKTIVDTVSHSQISAESADAKRVELLVRTLEKLERQISYLQERLSSQIARSQERGFTIDDIFRNNR